MKINNIQIFNILKPKEKTQKVSSSNFSCSNNISNPIYKDTFQKTSNVSFKGETNKETLAEFSDFAQKLINIIIKDICTDNILSVLRAHPYNSLDGLLKICVRNIIGDDSEVKDFCTSILTSFFAENGIENYSDMAQFIQTKSAIKDFDEIFGDYPTGYLMLYKDVKDKSNLVNYPALASMFNLIALSDPDMYSTEDLFSFLKKNGVKNEKDSLDKRISDLKQYFNNLETVQDKSAAIYFLMKSRDDELNKLQKLLDKKEIKLPAEVVYNYFPTIFDVVYLEGDGQGFGVLAPVIDDLIETRNLNGYPKSYAESELQLSSEAKSYFNFLHKLDKCNIPLKQYTNLLNKPFVVDVDPKLAMMLFSSNTKTISEIKNIDKTEAQKIYTTFGDCISGILDNDDAGFSDVDLFLDIVNKYGIKDRKAFADFYKKCNLIPDTKKNSNKKKSNNQNTLIQPEKLLEFVRLFKFDVSDDLFKEAKAKKISPKQFLLNEKKQYETVKKAIDDYASKNNDKVLAFQPALDIYIKYRKEFIKNPNATSGIVNQIARKEALKNQEYELYQEELNSFNEYFDFEKDKLKFIENSQIDLISKSGAYYRSACKDLLAFAKEQLPKEKYEEFVEFLSNNDFLANLQYTPDDIEKFISVSNDETLELILDKKIPSIQQLLSLIEQYSDENENSQNVSAHLNNALKVMSFEEYKEFLSKVQNKINSYGIDIKINDKNISCIPLDILDENNEKKDKILELLKELCKVTTNNKELNFVSLFPNAFTKGFQPSSEFQIAQEILSKSNSVSSQYKNLNKFFDIEEDMSSYRNSQSTKAYFDTYKKLREKMSDEFVDFVNSDEWAKITNDGKILNLSLHARMRLIERFALKNIKDGENISYEEMASRLNDILKAAYTSQIDKIEISPEESALKINFKYGKDEKMVSAVFDKNGKMITIYERKQQF